MTLAFDVLPDSRRYRLLLAKFMVMADAIADAARRAGRPLRVLDAGLGRAKLERFFRRHHPDVAVEWFGLDLLRYRLELTKDLPQIARVQGNLQAAIPFRDAMFDVVATSYVFQHLATPDRALAEHARVLKTGGRLIFVVPNSPQPKKVLREMLHPMLVWFRRRRGRDYGYLPQIQFYNLGRVRRMMKRAGLEPRRWQGIGYITGGPLAFLENLEWYYRMNLWAGARFPWPTHDLICVSDKPEGVPPPN